MAFTFPLANADFNATFPVVEAKFDLLEQIDTQGTWNNNLITTELAWPAWVANITIAPRSMEEARIIRSQLRRIGPHNIFYVSDPERLYPAHDPTGSKVQGSTVTVTGVSGRTIRLGGLPASYRLKWGDLFHVNWGPGNKYRSLFEVADDVSSGGTGFIGFFEVNPAPTEGDLIGGAVQLRVPTCPMRRVSMDVGITRGRVTEGITFQTMECQPS